MKILMIGLIPLLLTGGGSYKKLSAVAEARFFASHGRSQLGNSLHLHLSPKPFMRKPERAQPGRKHSTYYLFTVRGVKMLIHPANPHYRQFLRKKKSGKELCIKGHMRKWPGKIGPAFLVKRLRAISRPTRVK